MISLIDWGRLCMESPEPDLYNFGFPLVHIVFVE